MVDCCYRLSVSCFVVEQHLGVDRHSYLLTQLLAFGAAHSAGWSALADGRFCADAHTLCLRKCLCFAFVLYRNNHQSAPHVLLVLVQTRQRLVRSLCHYDCHSLLVAMSDCRLPVPALTHFSSLVDSVHQSRSLLVMGARSLMELNLKLWMR